MLRWYKNLFVLWIEPLPCYIRQAANLKATPRRKRPAGRDDAAQTLRTAANFAVRNPRRPKSPATSTPLPPH